MSAEDGRRPVVARMTQHSAEQVTVVTPCAGRVCKHREPCPGYARTCGSRWRRAHAHRHTYEPVGYGGAGWSLYRCACGATEVNA